MLLILAEFDFKADSVARIFGLKVPLMLLGVIFFGADDEADLCENIVRVYDHEFFIYIISINKVAFRDKGYIIIASYAGNNSYYKDSPSQSIKINHLCRNLDL